MNGHVTIEHSKWLSSALLPTLFGEESDFSVSKGVQKKKAKTSRKKTDPQSMKEKHTGAPMLLYHFLASWEVEMRKDKIKQQLQFFYRVK